MKSKPVSYRNVELNVSTVVGVIGHTGVNVRLVVEGDTGIYQSRKLSTNRIGARDDTGISIQKISLI